MLLLAVGIVVLAYLNVGLATQGSFPPGLLAHGTGLLVISLAFHLLLRWRASYADPLLLPIVTLLNGLGLVMIHRLDIAKGNSVAEGLALKQLTWSALAVAIAGAVLFFLRDHRVLRRYTFTAAVVGFGLLILPLVPGLGRQVYGSRIWIGLGPLSFQPGEIAKIVLAVFFAGYLVQTRDVLSLAGRKFLGFTFPRARDLGPILVAWAASLGVLIFEKDLGSSLLFFGLFVAMLYVATERTSWIAIGLVLFCGGAYVAYLLFGHVQQRVTLWLDTFSPEALAVSDQLARGLMGMANGGLLGTGLGRGRPDLTYFAESDFIIPSFAEEIGLFGVFALIMLYVLLVERGMRTALGVRDGFGKLLAAGLSFSLALQCFVVVGGVTRVIPLTGLTMPFLSYGGSSLLANWSLVALLLRISDHARRPLPEAAPSRPRQRGDRGGEGLVNAPIRRLSIVVAMLFTALLVSSTWIQFVQARELQERPDNRRTLLATYARERGQILVGGTPVARSVPSNDELKWLRTYPQGELYSHVTGYYSFVYGPGGGLEAAENALLSGQSDKLFYRRVSDMLTGRKQAGASLELTIDPKAQAAASEAMQGQRGAVVALDPSTGAILAMVSNPPYDPADLTSHDTKKVEQAWDSLNSDPTAPWSTGPSAATSTRRDPCSRWSRQPRPSPRGSTPRRASCPGRPSSTSRRPPRTCRTATACRAARTTR